MRRPLESRQDCSNAPNSVAWFGRDAARRDGETQVHVVQRGQLPRAIAASSVGPRTVLNAGHSNTAVSVYSAAYA